MKRNLFIVIGCAVALLIMFIVLATIFLPKQMPPPIVDETQVCDDPVEGTVCPANVDPVCGWFKDIQCIKYPCAQTYSNACEACQDSKVKYWTDNTCPE